VAEVSLAVTRTREDPMMRIGATALCLLLSVGCECGGTDGNPCANVDCSDHGICLADESSVLCSCDPGYEPVGLACVPQGGDSDTDTDTDTDSDTDSETGTGTETDTDTGTGTGSDTCLDADLDDDGHDSVACGGGDCADDDPDRNPGEADNDDLAWETEVAFDAEVSGYYASIVVDADGAVHVSHNNGGVGPGSLFYSTNASGDWVTDVVEDVLDVDGTTCLGVDSAGVPHVGYLAAAAGDLRHASDEDGWSTELVDGAGDTGHYCALEIGEDDVVHILYSDRGGPVRHASNEAGWVTELVAAGTNYHTSAAMNDAGVLHVSYASGPSILYTENEGGWAAPDVVAPGQNGAIGVGADGTVRILSWSAAVGIEMATSDGGGGWDVERVVGSAPLAYTALAIGADGVAHGAYTRDSGPQELMYATDLSGAWETAVLDPLAGAQKPSIAADAASVHVAYTEPGGSLAHAWRGLPDGIDQNCDGVDGVDGDRDGYASEASGGDDCDDAAAGTNPGAADDVCDGVDSNCDGEDGIAGVNVFLDDFERADGPLGRSVHPGGAWLDRTVGGIIDAAALSDTNGVARHYTNHDALADNYAGTRLRCVVTLDRQDPFVQVGFGAQLPDVTATPGLAIAIYGTGRGTSPRLQIGEHDVVHDFDPLDDGGFELALGEPYFAELLVDGVSATATLATGDYASDGGALVAEAATGALAGNVDGGQIVAIIDVAAGSGQGAHIDEIVVDEQGTCD
jgi:hypothetical protein